MTNLEVSIGEFLIENREDILSSLLPVKVELVQNKNNYTGPFETVFNEIVEEKVNDFLITDLSKNFGINEYEIRNIMSSDFITRFLGKDVYNLN